MTRKRSLRLRSGTFFFTLYTLHFAPGFGRGFDFAQPPARSLSEAEGSGAKENYRSNKFIYSVMN